MRAVVVYAGSLSLAGCAGLPDLEAQVDCSSMAVSGSPLEAADTNGDAALTDADLEPGSAVARLRWEGVDGEITSVVSRSTDVQLWQNARFRGVITWSIWHEAACDPELSVFLAFPGPDPYTSTSLEVGVVEAASFSIDVPDFEQGLSEPTVAGDVHLTDVRNDRVSGYFKGTAQGAVYSHLYAAPTGTVVTLEGMAFREVHGTTGVAR